MEVNLSAVLAHAPSFLRGVGQGASDKLADEKTVDQLLTEAVAAGANGLLGEIRTSGIFLHEDGTTGTIQQIDLSA